jgi:hypothetical protein
LAVNNITGRNDDKNNNSNKGSFFHRQDFYLLNVNKIIDRSKIIYLAVFLKLISDKNKLLFTDIFNKFVG